MLTSFREVGLEPLFIIIVAALLVSFIYRKEYEITVGTAIFSAMVYMFTFVPKKHVEEIKNTTATAFESSADMPLSFIIPATLAITGILALMSVQVTGILKGHKKLSDDYRHAEVEQINQWDALRGQYYAITQKLIGNRTSMDFSFSDSSNYYTQDVITALKTVKDMHDEVKPHGIGGSGALMEDYRQAMNTLDSKVLSAETRTSV